MQTFLEKVKTLYSDAPGLPPDKIGPTVGQNSTLPRLCTIYRPADKLLVGKITLPSSILQFWDLGGQRSLRALWPRYYHECHAVAFVIDAADRDRLHEAWEVFGASLRTLCLFCYAYRSSFTSDSVFSAPQILGVPLLLLANKQDSPESMSVEEIRESYDTWAAQHARDQAQREEATLDADERLPAVGHNERVASLDVMGISAIEG